MLNDVKIPPLINDNAPPANPPSLKPAPHSVPHPDQTIHSDPREPGTHHARYFGQKSLTDVPYATPLEDRGSLFSISLTIGALAIVVAVLVCVYVAIR